VFNGLVVGTACFITSATGKVADLILSAGSQYSRPQGRSGMAIAADCAKRVKSDTSHKLF
jgi:hypothetical protein